MFQTYKINETLNFFNLKNILVEQLVERIKGSVASLGV